jgi:K+-sensing histidine kinase KdpD
MTLASRRNGYLITILAVALATLLRLGLGLLWPGLPIFELYYVATLFVTVTCDAIAGVMASALGIVTGWWLFVPPQHSFFPVPDDTAASIVLSFFISAAIVAIAARE